MFWIVSRKDSDAGKDWRQEEKGTTEDEMVGWHHRFDVRESLRLQPRVQSQAVTILLTPWLQIGSFLGVQLIY